MSFLFRTFASSFGRRCRLETPAPSARHGKFPRAEVESWPRSLCLIINLILGNMLIQILNGRGGRELNSVVLTSALLDGRTLIEDYPFVRFVVPNWEAFCNIVCGAYSLLQKALYSSAAIDRIKSTMLEVVFLDTDGLPRRADVWRDSETGELHYIIKTF